MNQYSDFSIFARLFGQLFHKNPSNEMLASTFSWLKDGNLTKQWSLVTDDISKKALKIIQDKADALHLEKEFSELFGEQGAVSTKASDYGIDIEKLNQFKAMRNIELFANTDNVPSLLLISAYIEDVIDSKECQQQFFTKFLLPATKGFLGKVQAFDQGFYGCCAIVTRDLLSAMADELEE